MVGRRIRGRSAPARPNRRPARPAIFPSPATCASAATMRRPAWSSISATRSTSAPSRWPIPYRVVIDMPQVDVPVSGQDRRDRPRPDQGLPLRPGHAGRLAHGDRPRQAGPNRKSALVLECRQRPAGAAGARSCRNRPRGIHARHRAREPHAGASRPGRARAAGRKPTAIRVRWW